MVKAICIIRTSTEDQEVESQKKEIVDYAISKGYSIEDIKVIGGAGASAIKMDEEYQNNMADVKATIESNNIECVFAWAIDRIGRNEEFLIGFKNYLINKKIQLFIKNPSLYLFNEDGSVNSGMEIAISLFITMAKQEMEGKKARFARAKKRNADNKKFNGGKCVKLGYKLDDKGYVVIDEEQAKIVRLIFDLYNSGKYSTFKLAEELRNRGIWHNVTQVRIWKILTDTAYIGYTDKDYIRQGKKYVYSRRKYEPIISEQLFNHIQEEIKKGSFTKSRETKHNYFAIKLLKCQECGHNYEAKGISYRCWLHNARGTNVDKKCSNSINISIQILDSLLWRIASMDYLDFLTNQNIEDTTKYEEEIEVLNQKIGVLHERIANTDKTKIKAQIGWEKGIYSDEQYQKRINDIDAEIKKYNNDILEMSEHIERNARMIEQLQNQDERVERFMQLANDIDLLSNEIEMRDIVHQYIKNVYVQYFNNSRSEYIITIIKHNGITLRFSYKPFAKDGRAKIMAIWDDNTLHGYDFELLQRNGNNVTSQMRENLIYLKEKKEREIQEERAKNLLDVIMSKKEIDF